MTDQAKIVALAYDMGTLRHVRGSYAYVSNLRYRFNAAGDVIEVSKVRLPKEPRWARLDKGGAQ